MTTTRQKPPPLTLSAPGQPAAPLPQLPLDGTQGVQLSLAGSDFAAVEAAAAELKARFGARFAVLDRRVSGNRSRPADRRKPACRSRQCARCGSRRGVPPLNPLANSAHRAA